MKSLLRLSILTSIALFVIIACRKDLIKEELEPGQKPLNANVIATIKWYNETFKKSAEWTNYYSSQNRTEEENRKEPDWEHGIYNKLGNLEIIEFPLSKSNSSIAVPSSLNAADRKKIAAASLTRIAFIKNENNETVVREINYIPDWQYLQKKNFDISSVMYGKAGNDFTGRMIVKKWNDEVLSKRLVENGRITKSVNLNKTAKANSQLTTTVANRMDCITWDVCIEEQICKVWSSEGAVYKEECSPWTNTGQCYTESYCQEVNDGGSGTGGTADDGCDGIYARLPGDTDSGGGGGGTCPCEVYGTCVQPVCNMTDTEAEDLLNSITSHQNIQFTWNIGKRTVDGNGIIREPVVGKCSIYSLEFTTGLWIRYYANFPGVRYKLNPADRWKWESLEKSNLISQTGDYPICFDATMTASISTPVISANPEEATVGMNWQLAIQFQCLGGLKIKRFSGSWNGQIIPANF